MTEPLSPTNFLTQQLQTLRKNSGWLVALGIGLIVMGLIAIGHAAATSLLVGVFLAIVIIVGGLAHIIHALSAPKWSGFFLQLFLGNLLLIIGIALFFKPVLLASALALIIGIALLFRGVGQIVLAMQHRGVPNWFFFVLSGIIAAVLGLMIVANWPFSFEIVGVLVGIELLFEGIAFLMFGFAAKSLPEHADANEKESAQS